ncbi:MAG: ribosomal protein S20p, partial [Frankiales bacterium]|nr:ribosomal protein S20p [Frankiales bacterium]
TACGLFPRAQRTPRNSEEPQAVANIKSQIKRIKTNEKARLRNKSVKSSLKTAVRKFREAADAGDAEKAGVALREASRQLDKAVSKGVIHANQAANRKSGMASHVSKLVSK